MNSATLLEFPPVLSLEQVNAELLSIEQELTRRRYLGDILAWDEDKLRDHLWSGQQRILRAIQNNRRTAVISCHGSGKSFDAGIAVGWWLDTHVAGEAFVVTTAPTEPQVRVILWKEIGRVHSRGELKGRVNQKEWIMDVTDPETGIVKEETVALGRKPNDYSPMSFQGKHAPFVLVIVDEANGVRGPLWEGFDSLLSNDDSKILLIGNPDDPTGEFFEACKPGSGYFVVQIGAFDSPNFTGETLPSLIAKQLIGHVYVEEKRKKWAPSWTWTPDRSRCIPPPGASMEETHPFWQSKILGQFPVQSSIGSLIPLSWIRAAQARTLPAEGPNELGLDVGASEDGDPSCLGHRRGPVFRVLYEERQPDTMKTCGKLLQHLADPRYGADKAKVDYIGVGRGVVDRSREQNLPVYPISVGEAGTLTVCKACRHEWDMLFPVNRCPKCGSELIQKVFADLLSQLWWNIRGLFETGNIDIDAADEDLAGELLTIRWAPNSKGQTKVSYSNGPSPNRADSLLMTFAPVVVRTAAAMQVIRMQGF